MIKTLIFDVYGTIIAFEHGKNGETVREQMRLAGVETPKDEVHRLWGEYYRDAELNDKTFRTEAQIFQDRIAWLYERYGCKADPKVAYGMTSAESATRTAFPEAKDAIERLRRKYRVVIGSNTDDRPMHRNLEGSGIFADAYYTSEGLRVYKPRQEFYLGILRAEGIEPGEAVFIGDSPAEDVQAPKALGMHAIWVNRRKPSMDYGQDAEVKDLSEIETALQSISPSI